MSEKNAPDSAPTLTQAVPSPDFLASPTLSGDGTRGQSGIPLLALQAPHLPAVFGYVVSREVARGGMGVVYAAHDPTFDREVAVKVMHPGQDAERFVVESKVTARLPHPGIPPVYALGKLPDGRPFLAMKLIQGQTLADELQTVNGGELQRFLGAFEQICLTVGFAHAQGIIHRDLKPANVMIGKFGEVLVMDWGLAKELQNADCGLRNEGLPTAFSNPLSAIPNRQFSETVAGQVKGTPAYMAPEQARGERVDARADVFALGGILAVILTGRPPFLGDTALDTVLKAAQGELEECFIALDGCRADVELIAVAKKCLAVNSSERYASGAEVAAAVVAYRAGVEERLRRAERERAAAEAKAEEEMNTRREAEARAEAERAKANEQRKRRRTQLLLAGVVVLLVCVAGAFAWWQDEEADQRRLADEQARSERQRIEAEGKAAEARLAGERDAEARNKTEQARRGVEADLKLAADLRLQHKFKAASAALSQAADLAKSGALELLSTVEQALRDLAFVEKLDGIRFRKWVFIAQPGGKGGFNTRIASPEYRKAFTSYGLPLDTMQVTDAAERIAASSVKAEIVAAVDDWALYEPNAVLRNRLLAITRKVDGGEWTDRLRTSTIWKDKDAVAGLAANVDLATVSPASLSMLAELMRRNSLNPTALLTAARTAYPANFELAFALGQWNMTSKDGLQIGPYEAARALRPGNLTVWNNLGNALRMKGDVDGAIAAYKHAIKIDPKYAHAHYNMGIALKVKGDVDGAIAFYEQTIQLDPKYSQAHNNLGIALREKGNADGAIVSFKQAIHHDPQNALAHNNLGLALHEKGEVDDAIASFKQAISLDPHYAHAHHNLGVALKQKGDVDGAIDAYKQALNLDPKYAQAHNNLGVLLKAKGDVDGAIDAYKQAISADPHYAQAHNNLGSIYLQQKKYSEAMACAREAIKANPKYSNAHALLGFALQQTGDIAGARAALTEATRLDKRWAPMLAKLPPASPKPQKMQP